MLKILKFFVILVLLIFTAAYVLSKSTFLATMVFDAAMYFRDPYTPTEREQFFLTEIDKRFSAGEDKVPMRSVAPFEWDYVCSSYSYAPDDPIEMLIKQDYSYPYDEGVQMVVFIKNHQVVEEFVWIESARGSLETVGCLPRNKAKIGKSFESKNAYYRKHYEELSKSKKKWHPVHFIFSSCKPKFDCYFLTE